MFDLGNTLAAYYRSDQFGPILESAIAGVLRELQARRLSNVTLEAALSKAVAENQEAPDFRFRPMADRLARIFEVTLQNDSVLAETLCELFLRPIFALGRLYEDAQPVLSRLRGAGHPIAIVSNAPWGSPPSLWREELERIGLAETVDAVVLCGDVGWRKPAPEIFERAAAALAREPDECVFVGDDVHWDIAGSAAVGMLPVLIDRDGRHPDHAGIRVARLSDVPAIVEGAHNERIERTRKT